MDFDKRGEKLLSALALAPIAILIAIAIICYPGVGALTPDGHISLTAIWRATLAPFVTGDVFNWAYFLLIAYCALIFAAIVVAALRPKPLILVSPTIALFAGMMMLIFLPSLAGGSLNPDESQQLSISLTWRLDPNYFATINAGTHGPLINLPLILTSAATGFSLAFDYGLAHAWAAVILIMIPAIWLLAARQIVSGPIALVGILPVFALNLYYVAGRNLDFLAYNAHHISMLLLSCAVAAGFLGLRAQPSRCANIWLFLSGMSFGAMVFAKMQWMPIAAVIALGIAISTLMHKSQREWVRFLMLVAGGLFALTIGLGVVTLSGELSDFVETYLLGQLTYAGSNAGWPTAHFVLWAVKTPISATGGLFLVLLVMIWLLARRSMNLADAQGKLAAVPAAQIRLLDWVALIAILLSVASVVAPGNYSSHYCFLMLFVAQLGYFIFFCLFAHLSDEKSKRVWMIGTASVAAIWLLMQIGSLATNPKGLLRLGAHSEPWKIAVNIKGLCPPDQRKAMVDFVAKHSTPDEPISVWGWDYDVFVQTARANANKTGVAGFLSTRFGDVSDYANDYTREFMRARPPILVNAVVPGAFVFDDPGTQSTQRLPELQRYLDANYVSQRIGCYVVWVRKGGAPQS